MTMASSGHLRARGSTRLFWSSTIFACASQIAAVAIIICLTTTDSALNGSIYRIAWAASISELLSLIASPTIAVLYLRRTRRNVQVALGAIFVILAILAVLLTFYTITWIWNSTQQTGNRNQGDEIMRNLAAAGFAVCSISVVAQAVLYTIVFWPQEEHEPIPQQPTQEVTQRQSPLQNVKRSISVRLNSLGPPPAPAFFRAVSEPASPTFSSRSSSSLRRGANQVIRPVTSKTKLLINRASVPRDSSSLHSKREPSIEAMRPEDEFENWDTSGVEDITEALFFPRATTSRTRLETIPGSRPVSPAKPLNGPFPDKTDYEGLHLQNSPKLTPMGSPISETNSFKFSPPPTRRTSNADQSHIHPLFRSESPLAPPTASPGTIITASPIAGKLISPDHQPLYGSRKLHSAQGSRAESPSQLSPARSRQGSFRGGPRSPLHEFSPAERPRAYSLEPAG